MFNRYYLFYAFNRHRPFDFPQISVQRYYFFPIYTNYFAFFSLLLDSRLYFPLMSKSKRNFHNPPSNDYQSPTPRRAYTYTAVYLENNSKKERRKDEESTKKERVKDEQNTATTRQQDGNDTATSRKKKQRRSIGLLGTQASRLRAFWNKTKGFSLIFAHCKPNTKRGCNLTCCPQKNIPMLCPPPKKKEAPTGRHKPA